LRTAEEASGEGMSGLTVCVQPKKTQAPIEAWKPINNLVLACWWTVRTKIVKRKSKRSWDMGVEGDTAVISWLNKEGTRKPAAPKGSRAV
jgi:hypothetical protein